MNPPMGVNWQIVYLGADIVFYAFRDNQILSMKIGAYAPKREITG